jgi:dTMP kinase
VALLKARLEAEGRRVVVTREPGGTTVGEKIREMLLYNDGIDVKTEQSLFWAARGELVRKIIHPSLESGAIVISDRFTDSNLAYQGFGRGLDVPLLRRVNSWLTEGLVPDLTVLLDIPIFDGRQRKLLDDDTFFKEQTEFHERVRKGYLELAATEPLRWLVLDGFKRPQDLSDAVYSAVAGLLRASLS